jgi:ribokinase
LTPIFNFGSLNIDHVYRVDHIAQPGETISSHSYEVFAGGKGANQSAALARAGAQVQHAGRIGEDGRWLVDGLEKLGVDASRIVIDSACHTGHAVIQVEDATAENAILLFPGGNHAITMEQIEASMKAQSDCPVLLLQNEISKSTEIIQKANSLGWSICLNPAPFTADILDWPLDQINLLIVNQVEAAALTAQPATTDGDRLLGQLRKLWPKTEILLTLGAGGALFEGSDGRLQVGAVSAGVAVDTTAAGDTFIGYFLACRAAGDNTPECLRQAAAAAGICVTRHGARDSIPSANEVQLFLRQSC